MQPAVIVHGFETSNNMKVRIALGFKEIPYEFRRINPADRSEMLRLSGQYLTPVMEHGKVVVFDSAAIVRYLEANFRERPGLFGASRDEQWAIEELELFARATLAGPMMEMVHHRVAGGTVEESMKRRCEDDFTGAAERLIGALDGRQWLVGDRMSVADITAAAVMYRVRAGGLFEMPPEAETISGWIDRVMAYDRHLATDS
jgi:glutathione S-transferase